MSHLAGFILFPFLQSRFVSVFTVSFVLSLSPEVLMKTCIYIVYSGMLSIYMLCSLLSKKSKVLSVSSLLTVRHS